MLRKAILASWLVVAMPNAAMAQSPVGQGYGVGMRSCTDFAKDYAAYAGKAEDIYFTWAQGFMSALNLNLSANQGVYRVIDGAAMPTYKIQIRSFCDGHPLAPYAAAIMDLMASLPTQKTNSN